MEWSRPVKVIIAGTRTITDPFHVYEAMSICGWTGEITEEVCGASKGQVEYALEALRLGLPRETFRLNVDIIGAIWAIEHSIPVNYFPVTPQDWRTYGKPAGPRRNEQMAQYANALVLIWTGDPKTSKGSADMLARAKAHGLRYFQHIVEAK